MKFLLLPVLSGSFLVSCWANAAPIIGYPSGSNVEFADCADSVSSRPAQVSPPNSPAEQYSQPEETRGSSASVGSLLDEEGVEVGELLEEAARHRLAAEEGSAQAQYYLGEIYEKAGLIAKSEEETPRFYGEARRWYGEASQHGLPEGQVKLGLMFAYGRGVPQSDQEAVECFQAGAKDGSADAQYVLGLMILQGRGVDQSYEEAAQWISAAAKQGNYLAQDQFGLMCSEGLGIDQSDEEAVKWFQAAADQGFEGAQSHLGAMFMEGRCVDQSYEEAMKLLEAAEQKDDRYALKVLLKLYASYLKRRIS